MSVTVSVTLTDEEYKDILIKSEEKGLSVTQYVKKYPISADDFDGRYSYLKEQALLQPVGIPFTVMSLFNDWDDIPRGVKLSLGRNFYHLVKRGNQELIQIKPAGKTSSNVQLYVKEESENTDGKDNQESKLTIISQNLYNYRKKNTFSPAAYISNYNADYYAFQEYPDRGPGKTFHTAIIDRISEKNCGSTSEAEKEWKNYFPWSDMPNGYWSEATIAFENEEILIINIHISTSHADPLRLILLQRLEKLKNKQVILLGDLNAAFESQTDVPIKENSKFLSAIEEKEYVELLGKEEKRETPHYTYARPYVKLGKSVWQRKKLDHVFISNTLNIKFNCTIEYMDSVNLHYDALGYTASSENAFSDHTGIKISISPKTL